MEKTGEFDLLPKKEVIALKAERDKLQTILGGIRDMTTLPGALFVVDPHCEDIAVKEAKKLGIPVVAITDTNCDPDPIDYVIPGNDDAIRAVKLIASIIADAVIEANQGEDAVKHDVEETEEVSMSDATPWKKNPKKKQNKENYMNFTANDVKASRERTGAGMMDCKNALVETNGDMDKAVDYLREKGIAKAAKKAGRIAAEGIVDSYIHMAAKSAFYLK